MLAQTLLVRFSFGHHHVNCWVCYSLTIVLSDCVWLQKPLFLCLFLLVMMIPPVSREVSKSTELWIIRALLLVNSVAVFYLKWFYFIGFTSVFQ